MTLDKFGRSTAASKQNLSSLERQVSQFPRTPDGDIDVENVKISNVKPPTQDSDAATKRYVDSVTGDVLQAFKTNITSVVDDFTNKLTNVENKLSQSIKFEIKQIIDQFTRQLKEIKNEIPRQFDSASYIIELHELEKKVRDLHKNTSKTTTTTTVTPPTTTTTAKPAKTDVLPVLKIDDDDKNNSLTLRIDSVRKKRIRSAVDDE